MDNTNPPPEVPPSFLIEKVLKLNSSPTGMIWHLFDPTPLVGQNGCSFNGLREELLNFEMISWMFQQHQGESFSEAWTHFKDLLQKVPHHGIDLWLQIQIFYDHVNPITRRTIDQAASGKLRDKNNEESWVLLEDLALYDNESWNDPRDFAKPVKAISMPHNVPNTSDRQSIEQFLNNFANQPNEADMSNLESDDESVDTPLVSPFPHLDNDSDDGEVLNELSEYESVGMLHRERIINSFDRSVLAFQCMIGFRKFTTYLDPFLPMNIISRKAYNTIMVEGLENTWQNLVAVVRDAYMFVDFTLDSRPDSEEAVWKFQTTSGFKWDAVWIMEMPSRSAVKFEDPRNPS
ncbi:hypothetical protein Tco_0776068 [Tanacetum coccineum]